MENKETKNNLAKQQEEKRIQKKKKNEDSINSLWDNFKMFNIRVIGVPERGQKEQEIGNLSEKILKENFPNLVKEIHL